uniref:Increased recombination centers protein 6 n=1 Tax=Candidozyma auris TaxID=498019 RepID=A0A0L0P337_CANAR
MLNTEKLLLMIPNNVLVIGPPNSGKIRIAQCFSKDVDTTSIPKESHSGLIYRCELNTKYYKTLVNLLIEECPEERPSDTDKFIEGLNQWYKGFVSEEYVELRKALDGVIFTMNSNSVLVLDWEMIMDQYTRIKESLDERIFSVVMVAALDAPNDALLEQYEDGCIQRGIEFVYEGHEGTNEYKEKLGMERIKEILQTHTWSQTTSSTSEEYDKHKLDRIDNMTKGLLQPDDGEEMPLDKIMEKLRLEKSKVEKMKPENKESYVKLVIEDLLQFI